MGGSVLIFKKCKHAAPLGRISKTSNIQRDDFTYLFVRHHLLKKTKILQNRLSRKEYEKQNLKKYAQECETQHKTIKSELGADLSPLKIDREKKTETI